MSNLYTPPGRTFRRTSSLSLLLPIGSALVLVATSCLALPTSFLKASGIANLAGSGQDQQQSSAAAAPGAAQNGRTKIAEGEYAIIEQENNGAVGPFGEAVYDFHETWTLWRVPGQRYEVLGERQYESPKDVPAGHKFVDQLSRDLTALRITDYAKLKWNKDSGPLTCEFKPAELHCASGAHDPKRAVELNVPSDRPFGLLWPISVFSISGLARQAERDPERPNAVRLISITQPNAQQPIYPEILDGQLQYLGEEDLQAAGMKWEAHKFSFRVPTHPEFLLWTSDKGFLLALTVAHGHQEWRREGLRLVHFEQFADF
jgi:hypothetical protein